MTNFQTVLIIILLATTIGFAYLAMFKGRR